MKERILEILREHAPGAVSGEDLARRLGLSRTAVWKHVAALRRDGYPIAAAPRSGYRLTGEGPDRLTAEAVQPLLTTGVLGRSYDYLAEVDSTNNRAKDLARAGAPEGTVVLAERQTGGRGRLGRSWHSPHGGLWFSVILRPALSPARAPEATFVAAVSVVDALRAYPNLKVGIKWPNDLIAGGRKLGGILTELAAEAERLEWLVVGIGLNVNIELEAFPPALREAAASVSASAGRPVDRARLLAAILGSMERWYRAWLAQGFGPVIAAWRERQECLGRRVRIVTGGKEWYGRALAVDDEGALLVERAPGVVQRVLSGDVLLENGGKH
ncbi:MAG: biotin--[acetyl-CoA-carboxylase] ligase [Thermoanaerobacterales bacterium]|nr:biotin--[acetyl-CoA-carboxylase] ligase [Bacillota bacterium]MDI6907764.1 biotin--[acetyl-CoA-carboxylase] ligase [Thermoanaerobacterales bacterium]